MPLQKRIGFLGLKKQTAKGSAGTTPATYGLGVRGGSTLQVDVDQESDAITYGSRISPDENRLAVSAGAAIQTRLWPKSAGALLYGVLGGIVSTPGTPDAHVITPAATLPYWTIFSQLDTEYHKVADCKIDTLTISWSERSPVEVEVTFMGITATLYTSAWTATNASSDEAKFIPPGGLFEMDAASDTPAEAAITGGRISIQNGLVGIPLSKAITPDDVFEAEQVIEMSLTLQPATTVEWRKALTGSAAGTAPSGSPVFGSASVFFTLDADTDLTLEATRVAFTPGDYPELDPAGGPAQLEMAARIKKPAGSALTATLHNDVASY
jgi:hypothetical protein